ncbi:ABC transporter permease [Paenibacillus flagellatus]|uniref:Spermidine/putrescine ABC transporter n=1 Tax=Paenibacillus flagellatus TaxID=2211139 RepID=A0A2V5K1A7_9BACL|nr:ABC transporter permease [Paenibacillus flagellatus]PYI51293.1 spermidine/putrescine ABC transporter [Paenibacillus flagellatus]
MSNKNLIAGLTLLWVAVFILVPIGIMIAYSFWHVQDFKVVKELTLRNYTEVLTNGTYLSILWKTVRLAALVGLLAVLISYPLALFVHIHGGKHKEFLYLAVLAPLLVGYLIRVYAWRSILGEKGVINSVLTMTGILSEPTGKLLFNPASVVLTMLCMTIPFTFIPIYNSLEKIPAFLLNAAADLGANARQTFATVLLPLSLPGIVTGFMFAFVSALGDYMTPSLVGGTSGILIGNLIQSQFGNSFNWPLGSALAVVILAIALTVIVAAQKLGDVKGVLEEG